MSNKVAYNRTNFIDWFLFWNVFWGETPGGTWYMGLGGPTGQGALELEEPAGQPGYTRHAIPFNQLIISEQKLILPGQVWNIGATPWTIAVSHAFVTLDDLPIEWSNARVAWLVDLATLFSGEPGDALTVNLTFALQAVYAT